MSDDEIRLLHELRNTPAILDEIRADGGSELQVQRALRGRYPDDLVRAAMTLRELRARAAAKFSRADRMWFDRNGLEQSTAEPVARHKASRFSGRTWDLCCGIGADSIALAAHCDVVAVDRSRAACLRTLWNAEVYDASARVEAVCADVESLPVPNGLVHIDPDRRASGSSRAVRIEDYVPGPDFLRRLIAESPGGAIKLSPAANFTGKFPGTEIELISLDGEAKEATVWFGALAQPDVWRATVLPAGATIAGDPLSALPEMSELRRYLYDPDPAVVRAGLVSLLAEQQGFARLDDAEEYLTADALIDSPFARPFEVLAELPNNDREIRRHFRGSDFGQVEIKCRHVPVDADAVRRKLPLPGRAPGVLIFARVRGKTRAIVCRRVAASP